MNAITVRLFVLLFVATAAACVDASAQTSGDGARHQNAKPDDRSDVAVDVARIKKLLDEPPGRLTLPGAVLTPPVVTFYVEVSAYKPPPVPTLAEQIQASMHEGPWSWLPEVAALEHGLAAIASDLQILHPVNAIQAARGAYYRHKVAKTRREVEAELRAIEAQWAARTADSNTPKKQQ
jgi:hypothetical protein